MLKFTLSALWNLTDESPLTCKMFLEKGGIQLYLDVLKVYADHPAVETKVLGLLNNIAEVPGLRHGLLSNEFVTSLMTLLKSPHIDVSYFAAGIFAHLISDGEKVWNENSTERIEIDRGLVMATLVRAISTYIPQRSLHHHILMSNSFRSTPLCPGRHRTVRW